MRTFVPEYAMESLIGVHPNDAERCSPLFKAMAMRDALVI